MSTRAAVLRRSYRACGHVCREARSSFTLGFWLLPTAKRRAMTALYAFMRHTDDLADSRQPIEVRSHALQAWRRALEQSLLAASGNQSPILPHDLASGGVNTVGRAILPAVVDSVHRFRVPTGFLVDVIDGVEMDLTKRRYETFAELETYCERVASAVGLACIHIWGFHGSEAYRAARSCGVAMQLTNILRDLHEDASKDRVYVPLEDLRRCQYSVEELKSAAFNERFKRLVAFEAERAEAYYREGWALWDCLDARGRRIFAAMTASYEALLARIRRQPAEVLRRRVRLSAIEKLLIFARCLIAPRRL